MRLGYKDSTIVWYRGGWLACSGTSLPAASREFSLDLAMAWVDEACGFFV